MSYPQHYKGSVPPRLICGWDETNDRLREVAINDCGFMYTMGYEECIGLGCLPGRVAWSKIGYNPSVGTSEETIWTVGGQYVWPSSAMGMEVISLSTDDDVAGTGVQKVQIFYLNASYEEKSEIVEMDGTTAVATTAKDIYRVQSFRAYQTGTGLVAANNISLRHVNDSPVYSQIAQGYTRARNITYTVPKGYKLYISSITASCNSATKGVRLTTRATYDPNRPSEVLTFFLPYTEIAMTNGFAYRPLEIPTSFIEGVRIIVTGLADQDGAICSIALRGWLEPTS